MTYTPTKTKTDDLKKSIETGRERRIGGSDVGTVLGINPYKSAYTLWAEMTGRIDRPDLSNKISVWEGNVLEQAVADRFMEESGKKVHRSNMEYSLEEYPYMVGHIDRWLVGEKAGLECKTTSQLTKTDYAEGEVPPQYYAQCQFYMLVTGADHWYIAILQHSKAFYWMKIDRDDAYIDTMVSAVDHFFRVNVGEDVPPTIDGSESTENSLTAMYPHGDMFADVIDISSYGAILSRLEEIKSIAKDLDAERKRLESELKNGLGEATVGVAPGWKVTWKDQHKDEYVVKASDTRVFRVTKVKQKG